MGSVAVMTNGLKKGLACLATIHLFLALTSCLLNRHQKLENQKTVRVGSFLSLTGPDASFGWSTRKGLELAVSQINENGGVSGRTLELIIRDDGGKIDKAIKAVDDFGSDPAFVAILGQAASQLSLAAAPHAQKYGIPMISPSSTNPRVTEVGDFIFRVCFIDPFQGYVMAKFARENLKASRVAIIRDRRSEYSMGLAEYFDRTFRSLGGFIVAEEEFAAGDTDFSSQLSHIRSKGPDAIFIPGYYSEVALIAKQARLMRIRTRLLGGDGWDSGKLFELTQGALNGAYFSSHFSPERNSAPVKKFVETYKEKFGESPDGFAAMAYDAAFILVDAIEKATPFTRKQVRDQIALTRNFPGVTGSISLNSNRNADKSAVIFRIDGPNNRFVTTVEPN